MEKTSEVNLTVVWGHALDAGYLLSSQCRDHLLKFFSFQALTKCESTFVCMNCNSIRLPNVSELPFSFGELKLSRTLRNTNCATVWEFRQSTTNSTQNDSLELVRHVCYFRDATCSFVILQVIQYGWGLTCLKCRLHQSITVSTRSRLRLSKYAKQGRKSANCFLSKRIRSYSDRLFNWINYYKSILLKSKTNTMETIDAHWLEWGQKYRINNMTKCQS